MDSVIRASFVYLFLLFMFRLAGRRALSDMTTFDLVLLLIISEASQNAMLGSDYSIINGVVVITTLIGLNVLFTNLKHRSAVVERWLEGLPMILVENGQPLERLMDRARIDREDILAVARKTQGLERMEQIKYAVLEVDGGISIVPRSRVPHKVLARLPPALSQTLVSHSSWRPSFCCLPRPSSGNGSA